VTENFAAGVMQRLGFGYERLAELRAGIVYVSNSGFGFEGPYHSFKSWGPIAQAMSGLTHTSALSGEEPAGWGYSYMDHSGAYVMAIALLAALYHQGRTGEGQWVDIACAEAGITLAGLAALDATVNRRVERDIPVDSNRSAYDSMTPHGIFPCRGEDSWVAIACRHDQDWSALTRVVGEPWADTEAFGDLAGRLAAQDELEARLGAWTSARARDEIVAAGRAAGVPCSPVMRPTERCDSNPENEAWGLWPTVTHAIHGALRVDGLPVHLSATDWRVERGGPVLGQDNERVLGEILGLSSLEIARLADEGVI
jgi:crotonobetainyl-CoA:carnitine CoA-transferase CaiB-like acyl-CoA transferase